MIWLNKELSTLRKMGQALGLEWDPIDAVLREQVAMIPLGRSGGRRSKDEKLLNAEPTGIEYGGERSSDVAARRTEIRNMMRSDPRISTRDICKRLDYRGIPVPDSWTIEGKVTWQETLLKYPNKVHKLISVDRARIRTLRKS